MNNTRFQSITQIHLDAIKDTIAGLDALTEAIDDVTVRQNLKFAQDCLKQSAQTIRKARANYDAKHL